MTMSQRVMAYHGTDLCAMLQLPPYMVRGARGERMQSAGGCGSAHTHA